MQIRGNTIGSLVPAEPIKETVYYGGDPDSDQEDFAYYRRLSGAGPVDLPSITQERMQKVSLHMFRVNPYAHRIVKLIAAFSSGPGTRFKAEKPRIQQILNEHWSHPINRWEIQLPQIAMELGLYGEVFLMANVMENGDVTWGQIDPLRVKEVIPDERDKAQPAFAVISDPTPEEPGRTSKLEIIRYDGRPESETKGYRTGQVLFCSINQIRGGLRGMSDIFPIADYLDGIDQFMFALQQRIQLQNNFIWDVTLEGKSDADIRKWLSSAEGNEPRPGSIRAHNERVIWKAEAPEFAQSESAEHVRLFLNYILGGAGLAGWTVGDMSSANRAATESSGAVIMRTMEQRQTEVKYLLSEVFNFVLDQKVIAGVLPQQRRFDRRFYISMPKIGLRDFQRMSNSLKQGAQGISQLVEMNLVDQERGQYLANELINQLGLEGVDRYEQEDPVLKEDDDELTDPPERGKLRD